MERRNSWRDSVGAGSNTKVLLCISRLIRDKGVLQFAEAVEYLRRGGCDVRGVLVGPHTPDERGALSGAELSRVRARVHARALRSLDCAGDWPFGLAQDGLFGLAQDRHPRASSSRNPNRKVVFAGGG